MKKSILKKIHIAIEKIGTQAEVAAIFNITQPAISKWKKNGVPISKTILFCKALREQKSGFILEPSEIHPDVFL